MKNFTLLFALLLGSWAVQAQVAPEFEFTPDSVSILVPATEEDVPADLEIHSNSAVDLTIKWQRNVLFMTPGCATKVCDLNACYPETFNTKEFPLEAGKSGPISIHLINTTGNTCQAAIRLDMWNVENTDIKIPAFFFFNMTSSINDIFKLEEVKVFPNPATEYFTIQNDEVARVRMMTIDAREVASFDATQAKTFSLAGQQAGMYVLLMEDKTGKAIGVAQLDVK